MTASNTVESPAQVPPFRPDPEIIGNIEGNDRIRRSDRESTRRYLENHDLNTPPEDAPHRKGPAA